MNINTIRFIRNVTDAELIDIALKLLAHNEDLFNTLHRGSVIECLMHDSPFLVSADQLKKLREVQAGTSGNMKVTTIKVAREMFGIGLKEAKDLVEEFGGVGLLDRSYARSDEYNQRYTSVVKIIRVPHTL